MNLLSLSYDDLAEQIGISSKSGRARESRAGRSRLKDYNGAAGDAVQAAQVLPPRTDVKAVTVFAGRPGKQATDEVRRLEARITALSCQVSDLQDRLGAAERLAHDEQYRVVLERKKSAELVTQVHKLNARLRQLQQAEQDEQPRPWWRRLLSPVYL